MAKLDRTSTEVREGRKEQTALSKKAITHEERHNGQLYIFENVEALVCNQCGEEYLSAKILEEMDRVVREGRKPTRKMETPVFDLATTGSKSS